MDWYFLTQNALFLRKIVVWMGHVENPTVFINVDVIGDSKEMDTRVQVSCNATLGIYKYL